MLSNAKSGEALEFELTGVGEEPLAEELVALETTARTTVIRKVPGRCSLSLSLSSSCFLSVLHLSPFPSSIPFPHTPAHPPTHAPARSGVFADFSA